MTTPAPLPEVPVEKLRWRLDPASLPFESTAELPPLKEIIGQQRALEAFRSHGLRSAEPGEFTLRAFRSGRLDLLRAEAAELLDAGTRVVDAVRSSGAFRAAPSGV